MCFLSGHIRECVHIEPQLCNLLSDLYTLLSTLSNAEIKREKPNGSFIPLFSASRSQSSLAVVAESAKTVIELSSVKKTRSSSGFLDLAA